MKVAVVFYSFSDNTKKACLFLKDKLPGKEIELINLKLQKKETSFIKQCHQAFTKKTPELLETNYNLEGYDFLIFSSPVWAFTFAPALRTYLEKAIGIVGKKTACFLTYGSGAGKQKALNELVNILKNKDARILFSKNISGAKTKNSSYLIENLKYLLEMLSG